MSKRKDCMFQYAVERYPGIFSTYDSIEDTELITREEALELFNKYLPDFKKELDKGAEYSKPEIGIWVNCKSDTDYHTAEPHLDWMTKYDSLGFYNEKKEYIEL